MSLIVIVEDSRVMADAVASVLREAGHEAVGVLTVPEALSVCQERKADLVLTEYYVGRAPGLELIKKLAPRLPVAVCTGCGHEEVAAAAFALGALDWLVKTENYLRDLPDYVQGLLDRLAAGQKLKDKQQYLHSQKTQNELAEWLAHNFKNILAASIGYLNLIDFKNETQTQAKREEYLNESRQSQKSAIDLLEQLLRLTEAKFGEAECLVVADLVDEAWAVAKGKVLQNMAMQYPDQLEATRVTVGQMIFINSARTLEPVRMISADLSSILEALLQNALEAVLRVEDPRILVLGETRAGYLDITVRDNGRGMNDNVLKHALEPFFSTKGEVGVGLSLSLVNSLVMRHGGDLSLKSHLGGGTVVKISLPLVAVGGV